VPVYGKRVAMGLCRGRTDIMNFSAREDVVRTIRLIDGMSLGFHCCLNPFNQSD
jgi:hypothetical protein